MRLVGVLAAGAFALAGCGAATGEATESSPVTRAYVIHGTGTFGQLDPGDYPDARGVSAGSDMTLEEAREALARQDSYDQPLHAVRAQHRSTFTAAGMTDQGAFLVFTEAPAQKDLQPEFAGLPGDTVVYTGAPMTQPRLDELVSAAVTALRSAGPTHPEINLQADVPELASGVVVSYDPTGLSHERLVEMENTARASLVERFRDDAAFVTFRRDPHVRVYEAQ